MEPRTVFRGTVYTGMAIGQAINIIICSLEEVWHF